MNAIAKPIRNSADGTIKASLISNASFNLAFFGSILIRYLAIINSRILIKIKSRPYKTWDNSENGLLATKIVRYGINETTNNNRMFNQIILESILST